MFASPFKLAWVGAVVTSTLACTGNLVRDASAQESDWANALLAATPWVDAPAPQELNDQSRGAFATLHRQLQLEPDGAALAERFQLTPLATALEYPDIDAAELWQAAERLETSVPLRYASDVHRLRSALHAQAAAQAMTAADFPQRYVAAVRLIAAERQAGRTAGPWQPTPEFVAAYELLCRTLVDRPDLRRPLDDLRYPNHATRVDVDYLQQLATRQFSVALNIDAAAENVRVTASDPIQVELATRVNSAPDALSLTMLGSAAGQIGLGGNFRELQVNARSQVGLASQMQLRIAPDGIILQPEYVDVRLRTSNLRVCSTANRQLGRNLISGLAERIVSKRLPTIDQQAAAKARPAIQERLTDEAYELAFRINGLFARNFALRLSQVNIDPEVCMHSDQQWLTWAATYAQPWQMPAPVPPPWIADWQPAMQTLVHQSLLNNIAGAVAGIELDESLWLRLLTDDLKLESLNSDTSPARRIPTALRFSEAAPLTVEFGDQRLRLSLTVAAWRLDGEWITPEAAPRVEVDYRIDHSESRTSLQRQAIVVPAELPADMASSLSAVIDCFLPGTLRTQDRFRSSSFEQHLRVRELQLRDGWLIVGLESGESQ